VAETMDRIHSVLGHFASMPTNPRHPMHRITAGLVKRLNECAVELGLDLVIAESELSRNETSPQQALSGAGGQQLGQAADINIPFNYQESSTLSDEFVYTDFAQLAFPTANFDFLT
jgi:hypothetical protein